MRGALGTFARSKMGRRAGELMLQMVLGPLCLCEFAVTEGTEEGQMEDKCAADVEQKCNKAGLASEARRC